MKKNLYDLLEVSPHASQESISISYHRLAQIMDPDLHENLSKPDARISFNLMKEAYVTLSNPERRRAYDFKLQEQTRSEQIVYVEPFWDRSKILAATLLLVASVFVYIKYTAAQEQAQAIRDQAVAEQKRAEALAQAKISEEKIEAARLAKEERDQQRQYQMLEEGRRRSEQVSQELAYAEREAQREAKRESESQERKRLMEARDAENRARRDQAERERKLRELDYRLSHRR